jgi:hypothetical protein
VSALAGIVLALALASPASAATVARTTPEAGPVLAGAEVLWGTEASDGSVRVMARAPRRPPRLLHRVAAPTGEETTRVIGPLVASRAAFAVRVRTATAADADFDWENYLVEAGLLGGPLSGSPSLLFGSIPEYVDDRSCEGRYEELADFDVDGARFAVGTESGPCAAIGASPPSRFSIVVHDGGLRRVVEAGSGHGPLAVALAGRFLAWRGDRELVVHDLESGATEARIRSSDLGGGWISDFDLQADGSVVLVCWCASERGRARLFARIPSRPGVLLLDRRVTGRLVLAGGRVLYERRVGRGYERTALLARPVAGGPARILARLGALRDLASPPDLDETRATWGVRPVAGGRGRIVLRAL